MGEGTYVWYVQEMGVETVHVHKTHDAQSVRDQLPCKECCEEDEKQKCETRESKEEKQKAHEEVLVR